MSEEGQQVIKKKTIKAPWYLEWVRTLPCVVCGSWSQAHHLKGHGHGGTGKKVSDLWVMPLCAEHHAELHNHGHVTWERKYGKQEDYIMATLRQALRRDKL